MRYGFLSHSFREEMQNRRLCIYEILWMFWIFACCSSFTISSGKATSPQEVLFLRSTHHPLLYQHPYCNITWSPSLKIITVGSGRWSGVAHDHRYIFAADQAATLQQQQPVVLHAQSTVVLTNAFTCRMLEENDTPGFSYFAPHSGVGMLSVK